MSWLLKIWTWIVGIFRFFSSVFLEEHSGVLKLSLGRVALIGVLAVYFWIWARAVLYGEQIEDPPGLFGVFSLLAGYVLGTKVIAALRPPPAE